LSGAGDPSCTGGSVTTLVTKDGPLQGGNTLTLTGTGLLWLAGQGTLAVTLNGNAACGTVTVADDNTLTCVAPASTLSPSKTGVVSVDVSVGGTSYATFKDAYTYRALGELVIGTRAWTDVPALTGTALYDALMAQGNGGATEILDTAVIAPGTAVAWTYTVTYVYAPGGTPVGGSADVGLNGVDIVDDQLGAVCTIPVLYLNTPVGCAAGPAVIDP
ncbi:MAG: IPT/TIG domain-containing protein, partial [Actinomycetia bacterium]|nr:IPT/TIG domain-containing protein [Actinomycetes bacterium]